MTLTTAGLEARRARRTWIRVAAADPACRIDGDASGLGSEAARTFPTAQLMSSSGPFHQALCFALQFETRILMSPARGQMGNALHGIEDAFRFAMFFAQNGFDDVQGSDRHRDDPHRFR